MRDKDQHNYLKCLEKSARHIESQRDVLNEHLFLDQEKDSCCKEFFEYKKSLARIPRLLISVFRTSNNEDLPYS